MQPTAAVGDLTCTAVHHARIAPTALDTVIEPSITPPDVSLLLASIDRMRTRLSSFQHYTGLVTVAANANGVFELRVASTRLDAVLGWTLRCVSALGGTQQRDGAELQTVTVRMAALMGMMEVAGMQTTSTVCSVAGLTSLLFSVGLGANQRVLLNFVLPAHTSD